VFVLYLNPMREGKSERLFPVARAESRGELEALLAREKVEGYRDGPWRKVHRKGGPLEWFNPLDVFGEIRDMGTLDLWLEETARSWEGYKSGLPEAKDLA
jgi:hypothetical protein